MVTCLGNKNRWKHLDLITEIKMHIGSVAMKKKSNL